MANGVSGDANGVACRPAKRERHMPRKPNPMPSKTRHYRIPIELAEWLEKRFTLYKQRNGKLANTKTAVLIDALERIRAAEQTYAVPPTKLTQTEVYRSPQVGTEGAHFRLPNDLIEWIEDYYRYHRMPNGKRAANFTDLVVDALRIAMERDEKEAHKK